MKPANQPGPTMSLKEVVEALRAVGIPSTNTKVADGIVSGAYPFGRLVAQNGSKRCFEIFRVDFVAWLNSKLKWEEISV